MLKCREYSFELVRNGGHIVFHNSQPSRTYSRAYLYYTSDSIVERVPRSFAHFYNSLAYFPKLTERAYPVIHFLLLTCSMHESANRLG